MDGQRILPVIVSIGIIIAIAILRDYSRTFAAVAAVMPLNIPLGMWLIYSGAEDHQQAMIDFNRALLINILPTLLFMLVAWQTARAGWGLVAVIASGYISWAVGLGVVFLAKSLL